MIDRYAFYSQIEQVIDDLSLSKEGVEQVNQYYNAAPTQKLSIITNKNPYNLSFFTWGGSKELAKNKPLSVKLVNYFIGESLTPSQYKTIEGSRCIIPANGFFLWKPLGKRKSVPYYFYHSNNLPLYLAGVWDEFEDIDSIPHATFRLITRPTSGQISHYQTTQPLLFDGPQAKNWLKKNIEKTDIQEILEYAENHPLISHPVSPNIQFPEANDPSLIDRATPSDQLGNYTLFG